MDAPNYSVILLLAAQRVAVAAKRMGLAAVLLLVAMGAQQRTPNFIIETADPNFARQLAGAAEQYRRDLAISWLGKAMPKWAQPCVLTVQAGPHLGAGGATTFVFDRGEVFGWRMSIQGSQERLLDSVLPHEITHMVFASHFRQPLPRWADEGGATSVEHASEKNKHRTMLNQFLRTGRGIAFSDMFAMTEYPKDIMPLYAQGYSLAEYLIQSGGRPKFIEFLREGLETDDWPGAIQRHYGLTDLSTLQDTWLAWVKQGSPSLRPRDAQPGGKGQMLAADQRRARPEPNLIVRVRDKQPAPLATLVPVPPISGASEGRAVAAAAPPPTNSSALKWVDPRRSAPGSAGADPLPTAVAHPQPMQRPQQTVPQ